MTERTCGYIGPNEGGKPSTRPPCGKPAEWELWAQGAVYEHVDSCTAHVGDLLDDSPETVIRPITGKRTMGGDPGIQKMR